MQKLNQIQLSQDGSVVSLGPGARWGEVTNFLAAKGLAAVGGRVNSIGVGGLLVGGECIAAALPPIPELKADLPR